MKPCLLTVKLLIGEASHAKIRRLSPSSDTVQRRISGMMEDVKDQMINGMKASPMFSFA